MRDLVIQIPIASFQLKNILEVLRVIILINQIESQFGKESLIVVVLHSIQEIVIFTVRAPYRIDPEISHSESTGLACVFLHGFEF